MHFDQSAIPNHQHYSCDDDARAFNPEKKFEDLEDDRRPRGYTNVYHVPFGAKSE